MEVGGVRGEVYLITDDKIDAEDTEETQFVDDVLLGRRDHLLVRYIQASLSLVPHYCALIRREIHSYEIF